MRVRSEGSVAGPVRTPRLMWQVTAYNSKGVYLAGRVCTSLTSAYRMRDSLLRHRASVVVVEVL